MGANGADRIVRCLRESESGMRRCSTPVLGFFGESGRICAGDEEAVELGQCRVLMRSSKRGRA